MNQTSKIFKTKTCSPATYALSAVSNFGLQCLQWDPLVLRDAFQDLTGIKLTNKQVDKLQAGITMLGTNACIATIQGFLFCGSLCNNKPVRSNSIPYITLRDACWTIYLYQQLLGDQQLTPEDVCSDIKLYIKELMKVQGLSKLPQYMQFMQVNPDQFAVANAADIDTFQAYNIRQTNSMIQLNKYVASKQNQLLQQLKQLEKAGFVNQAKAI